MGREVEGSKESVGAKICETPRKLEALVLPSTANVPEVMLENLAGNKRREAVSPACMELEKFRPEKPVILLISGLETRTVWSFTTEQLRPQEIAFAQYQIPGLSGDPKDFQNFTPDKILEGLKGFVRDLRKEANLPEGAELRLHLVGHSMGGNLAILLAADTEFLQASHVKITGVDLLAPALRTRITELNLLRSTWLGDWARGPCEKILPWLEIGLPEISAQEYRFRQMRERFKEGFEPDHENDRVKNEVFLISKLPIEAACTFTQNSLAAEAAVSRVTAPVWLFEAGRDALVREMEPRVKADLKPRVRFSFPQLGHFLPFDKEVVAAVIEHYTTRH